MRTVKYIPDTDAGKAIWLANFSTKLPLYATRLGLSNTELSSVQADNAFFQYVISVMELHRKSLLNLVSYKNLLKHARGTQHIGSIPVPPVLPVSPPHVPEGIFTRITRLATRIKHNLAYSNNIGADLGIITPSNPAVDITTLQPELTIKLDVGRPKIKWIKGVSEAIDLYADRNDSKGFIFAGRFLKNTYIDTTGLSAGIIFDEWKYKAIYVIGDKQTGLFSRIISVDVKKM